MVVYIKENVLVIGLENVVFESILSFIKTWKFSNVDSEVVPLSEDGNDPKDGYFPSV